MPALRSSFAASSGRVRDADRESLRAGGTGMFVQRADVSWSCARVRGGCALWMVTAIELLIRVLVNQEDVSGSQDALRWF